MTSVWDPITIGDMRLPHRFAMAPMTRSRAGPGGVPGDLAPLYYAQRASMGLLISEGTQPSDDGQGYMTTPGIYTDAHVAGWKKVAKAVHEAGGRFFIQLMHVGRVSHPDNTPHHRTAVAPSAVAPGTKMFTANGMQDIALPRALATEEIEATVQDFRYAAARAIEAGADGVEIHGANGYLVHQFFAPNSNLRTDRYGGSIQNRARFAIEVASAIAQEIGPERTAIRLSPSQTLGGVIEGPEGPDLYRYLVPKLQELDLAYLHYMHFGDEALLADIRRLWRNPLLLLRFGRTPETLADDVENGLADMIPIGKLALANPDFIERYKRRTGFNQPVPAMFYGGDGAGYTDYPMLTEAEVGFPVAEA